MRKTIKHALISVSTILIALTLSLQAGIGSGESSSGTLPVELTSFSASINGDVVLLSWTTATEVNNYGFSVLRHFNKLSASLRSATEEEWETIGFVNGHGNSNSPKDYSYIDSEPLSGAISYRLKQIDTDGKFEYSSVIELKNNLSKEYVLEQNYPNPFNPSTVISYSIPKVSHVSVKVFDVLGNTLATLVNESQGVGSYKVVFNATELSNGVYFYRINAGEFTSIKKMLLIK